MSEFNVLIFLGGMFFGIYVFYRGYIIGRNTRYQDDNIQPPPDPTQDFAKKKPTWIELLMGHAKKREVDIKKARARAGVISENEIYDPASSAVREEIENGNG